MTDDDLGVAATNLKFVHLFGWIFREQAKKDNGIDAHVEIQDERAKAHRKAATGRLLALQIKSGPSWLKEKTKNGYVYRGIPQELFYWLAHSLPVLVVLYDPDSDICYWEHVTKDNVTVTGAMWKMVVPFAQKIQKSAEKTLRALAHTSDYDLRIRQLVLAKPWMEIVRSGQQLFMESTISNDGSGQGTLDLWVRDSAGNEHSKYHWPYFSFPKEAPNDLFPRLFPWANFRVDAEMYKAQIRALPNGEMEPGLEASVTAWLGRQSQIIPVGGDADQVVYSLQLTLNNVGKAFMILDQYLSTGTLPTSGEN